MRPRSFVGRLLFGKLMTSTRWLRLGETRPWLLRSNKPTVTLDVFVPFSKVPEFLRWYQHGTTNYHRLIEEKLRELGGVKTLMSHNYYSEDEFWSLYNRRNYDAVKAISDPRNLFRDLYTRPARQRWGRQAEARARARSAQSFGCGGARDLLPLRSMNFFDRSDAGRQLGIVLRSHGYLDPVVVGLVRGGVPVAAEVARTLDAPLEICIVRKLVAPGEPPLTIGAVAEGTAMYLDDARIQDLGLTASDLEHVISRERSEVARLGELLRDRPPLDLLGRDVILVDDVAITGGTIRAAARAMHDRGARSLELAVPVGASDVIDTLRPEFDRVSCLFADRMLVANGARYTRFLPVSEAEVIALVAALRRGSDRAAS